MATGLEFSILTAERAGVDEGRDERGRAGSVRPVTLRDRTGIVEGCPQYSETSFGPYC